MLCQSAEFLAKFIPLLPVAKQHGHRLLHLVQVQGTGEDIFVLAMDFGIFGYHGTIS